MFKDYSPSASDGAAAAKEPPASKSPPPPPPKKEVEETVSSQEPKISRPSTTPSESRIFASPLARRLAEDHSVSMTSTLFFSDRM